MYVCIKCCFYCFGSVSERSPVATAQVNPRIQTMISNYRMHIFPDKQRWV